LRFTGVYSRLKLKPLRSAIHIPERTLTAIVVIGGSAGAYAGLRTVLSELPADFPAPICVVIHIGRYSSEMPGLLTKCSALPVEFGSERELSPGHVYIAPPDHHLIVERGRLKLSRAPRENFARPSIDPLFRSAAHAYGADVVGVLLSGRLNDGTPGFYEIKRCGGTTVIEDPDTAEYGSMPSSALEHVAIDHRVPVGELADLIVRLTQDINARSIVQTSLYQDDDVETQRGIAQPSSLTCPDCGGATRRLKFGSLVQYECHIGHRFTTETLADEHLLELDASLETAVRELNERAEICRLLAEDASENANAERQRKWSNAADQARQRMTALLELFDGGWVG
jgi:two-component system chemotaxis response regulator CheB